MAWGLIPMVVALYSRRPALPRIVAASPGRAAIAVAASRVWLGVHWTSDAVAGLLVGLLAVCLAERFVAANGCACRRVESRGSNPSFRIEDPVPAAAAPAASPPAHDRVPTNG